MMLVINVSLSATQTFEFPLLRILYLELYLFLIGLFVFLIFNFLSSLYSLDIKPLSKTELFKIFSYSVVCHFVQMTVSFAMKKLLSFMTSHLLLILLMVSCSESLFCANEFKAIPQFLFY